MKTAALIMAAGRGSRVADAGPSKQYLPLGARTVLGRAAQVFIQHPRIDSVQVVIHPDDVALYRAILDVPSPRLAAPVMGGTSRQQSVLRGLEALAGQGLDAVLVHDAARPFTPPGAIDAVLDALATGPAAIAAQPVTDTLKRVDGALRVIATVARDELWRAQTPQGFRFAPLLDAHRRAAAAGRSDFTDDAALAEWAGMAVAIVPVQGVNMKITTADDVAVAQALAAGPAMESRTGTGFDVHRFMPGDHVWLCGLRIPHTHGLEGHSDADVALHALTDALLGAIGDGDIGQHFPPSDPQWRGAPSHLFAADPVARIAARGGRIVNVDLTLLCEAPRIGPHRDAMRARVAEILGIALGRVGVKATTTEGLGFTGRREGLAAMAVATVLLPA